MRLFTAIDLPAQVVSKLERLLDTLRPTANIKWSPVSNLHITTKFIGEWPEERLGELRDVLSNLPKHPPIELTVRGVGFFPNPHNPRVFWAAVHPSPWLAELAGETEQALAGLGIAVEKRPFSPHLTLARIKEPVPLVSLRQAIAALPDLDFGAYTTDRFHLYQSRLHRSGSTYTKMADFVFAEESQK